MSECPICRAKNIKSWYRLHDDRFGAPGYYTLFQCKECNHGFLDTRFSLKALSDLYSRYYPRSNLDPKEHRPHVRLGAFRAWLHGAKGFAHFWVPTEVRVLDVGCGAGESLGYYQSQGCEAYGVEADANVRRVAEERGYQIRIGAFDPSDYAPEFFDYVTIDQVLEHMPNPVETLKGVAKVLKPNGKVIIAVPNVDGWGALVFRRNWINWHAPYHLHHFSKCSIGLAATQSGFRVLMHRTITNSDWLLHQWAHLVASGRESSPSPYWSESRKWVRWQLVVVRAMRLLLHRSRLDHLISRVSDLFGLGDNQVIILEKAVDSSRKLSLRAEFS